MGLWSRKNTKDEYGGTDSGLDSDTAVHSPVERDEEKAIQQEHLETTDSDVAVLNIEAIDPQRFKEVEKRVLRKLDLNLLLLVFGLYLLAFLDRSNIGNAEIAGLSKGLHFHGQDYEWLLTIFYISYILFEPGALMWKLVPPHYWATFCVFVWGLVSTLQASAQNWGGMMALRFFMGASEASYGPGVPYLLSFFYLRHEVGVRNGFYLSAAALASTFAGALAYAITSGHPAFAAWRVLFLVEGLPTLAMVPVTFFLLPDSPDKCRFLNAEEKAVAKARGVKQAGGTTERLGRVNVRDIGATLLDPKAWFTALMYFSCNVSFSSLPVFLPTILNQMGFSAINAQGLTAPPYFLAFIVTFSTAYIADRTGQRGLMIMALSAIGGIGYVILATVKAVAGRYFAVYLVACGVFPAIGNILPWVTNNQGTDTRRGSSIMLLNLVGQCGPILGTRLYPTYEGPRYVKGMSVCAAFMFFTTLLAFSLRLLLVWENKQLDRKHGTVAEQKAALAQGTDSSLSSSPGQPSVRAGEAGVGTENYGPMFRYVL